MKPIQKQSGAVLMVGLVMLLVLSTVVIASSRTTAIQLKMTSNLRDNELAFQSAESVLRLAERYVAETSRSGLDDIVFDGTDGFYTYSAGRSLSQESDWTNLNTKEATLTNSQVAEKPNYIIEEINGIRPLGGSLQAAMPIDDYYFRLTTKSKGGTNDSLVVLQSVYKK